MPLTGKGKVYINDNESVEYTLKIFVWLITQYFEFMGSKLGKPYNFEGLFGSGWDMTKL